MWTISVDRSRCCARRKRCSRRRTLQVGDCCSFASSPPYHVQHPLATASLMRSPTATRRALTPIRRALATRRALVRRAVVAVDFPADLGRDCLRFEVRQLRNALEGRSHFRGRSSSRDACRSSRVRPPALNSKRSGEHRAMRCSVSQRRKPNLGLNSLLMLSLAGPVWSLQTVARRNFL